MNTEVFINLLKKELNRQASKDESDELKEFLQKDEDFAAVYAEVTFNRPEENKQEEIEEAYAIHLNRMKMLKLI